MSWDVVPVARVRAIPVHILCDAFPNSAGRPGFGVATRERKPIAPAG
jgi:hypothetical protein